MPCGMGVQVSSGTLATLSLRVVQQKATEHIVAQIVEEIDTQQRLRQLMDVLDDCIIFITSLGAATAQVCY